MSDLVNLGIFYTGNRKERHWDDLVSKYAITTENRDFFDHNYAGAEFDSSGFVEIMTHIADGLRDPQCDTSNGFNIEYFGKEELDKNSVSEANA